MKSFAAGLIVGTICVATAAVARSDDEVAFAYAATFGGAVCATLDDFPSFGGILGVASAIQDDGLSSYEAGQVIGLSVAEICPRHTRLMVAFMKVYGATESVA